MTLPSSGPISLLDIFTEFPFSGGGTINLFDYYRGGPAVPDISSTQSIPTSGEIKFPTDFYGTSNLQAEVINVTCGVKTTQEDLGKIGVQNTTQAGFSQFINPQLGSVSPNTIVNGAILAEVLYSTSNGPIGFFSGYSVAVAGTRSINLFDSVTFSGDPSSYLTSNVSSFSQQGEYTLWSWDTAAASPWVGGGVRQATFIS